MTPREEDVFLTMLREPERFRKDATRRGLMRAKVLNVNDPELRYRIQVRILQVHLDAIQARTILGVNAEGVSDELCPWAEPCFPFGGAPDHGFFALPKVGSTVWVSFELGLVDKPIWLGAWLGTGDVTTEGANPARKKPSNILDGPDRLRIMKTPYGHVWYMDDGDVDAGISPKIKIATPRHSLILDDLANGGLDRIELKTLAGVQLELDNKAASLHAKLALPSGAQMIVEDTPVPRAEVSLDPTKKIEMDAAGIRAIDGPTKIEITPGGTAQIDAPTSVAINSPILNFTSPTCNVIANATETVIQRGGVIIRINAAGEIDLISAAKVNISGGALVQVAAALVQILAGTVDLAAPGGQPVILGTAFKALFEGHVHTSAAPGLPTSTPQFPFGVPALLVPGTHLSTKVNAAP